MESSFSEPTLEVDHKDQMEPTKTLPGALSDDYSTVFEKKRQRIRRFHPEELNFDPCKKSKMESSFSKSTMEVDHKDLMEPTKTLPDVWPDENYFKEFEEKELLIRTFDPEDARMMERYEDPRECNVYDMKAEINGRALIINNYHFERLHDRLGSEKDVDGLVKLFTKLGFELEVHVDLTHDKMKELFARECRRDYTDYNSFFLFIMSYGDTGVVFGTDGYKEGRKVYNSLNIEDITFQFCEVKSLERKPKVFITEADQGSGRFVPKEKEADSKKDEEEIKDEHTFETARHAGGDPVDADRNKAMDGRNVEVDDEDGSETSDPNSDDGDEEEDGEDSKHDRRDETNPIMKRLPDHVLTMKSSADGFVSYRNSAYGSWFIQAFIISVTKYAWKHDFLTLMHKVRRLLGRARTPKTKRRPKHYGQAIGPVKCTFCSKYFFFLRTPLETKGETQKASMSMEGDEKDSIYMKEVYDSLFNV